MPALQTYTRLGVQYLEWSSYLINGILLLAIAWAWLHGRDTAAGVEFSTLAIPAVIIPAFGFAVGIAEDVGEMHSRRLRRKWNIPD